MQTLRNTKFWITLATLVLQLGMFLVILFVKPEILDAGLIMWFVGAAAGTLGIFGTLNVVASSQAPKTPQA